MSWKEIKRIEQIVRRERGEKAIVIRLVKEDDKIISLILSLEDKNSINSIELSINDWDDLLSLFKSIDSEIKTYQTPKVAPVTEQIPNETYIKPKNSVPVQETLLPEPEIDLASMKTEETPSEITILHKTIKSTPKTAPEIATPKIEDKSFPDAVVIEQLKPPKIEKTEKNKISETAKLPTPQAVVIEHFEPPPQAKNLKKGSEPKPAIEAVVDEGIKPITVPKPSLTEPEETSTPKLSEYEPIALELSDTTPPPEKEVLYPPMPPEVKEIFEELDTQAIELEKTLLDVGVDSTDDEITKETKITNAMQEVAELMPPGAAKDFVEQMILKRKENIEISDQKAEDQDVELVLADENQKERNKKENDNQKTKSELKYW
ncbi:MAG: hypothetical protein ACTSRG_18020 [Candidatus Helarchaeota archaeon]